MNYSDLLKTEKKKKTGCGGACLSVIQLHQGRRERAMRRRITSLDKKLVRPLPTNKGYGGMSQWS
jgi:hypothetical protein